MNSDETRTFGGVEPSKLLAGRFSIVRHIGAGGMGAVYEAFDIQLSRPVALKLIHPHISGDPRSVERFKSELTLGREVAHVNLCRLYDFGIHSAPESPEVFFLTMELIEGITLAYRLKEGPLSRPDALAIARQISQGLDALHQAGIVHHDLKPANILLSSSRGARGLRVVITDFGLAREVPVGAAMFSPSTEIAGTPRYMAPEQLLGMRATAASDVYSFGLILYEMAAGKHPFDRNDLNSAKARLSRVPPGPRSVLRSVDAKWDRAIVRALDPEPAKRFASASELVDGCDRKRLTASATRLGRWKSPVVAVGALALGIGGFFAAPPLLRRTPPPDAQAAYDRGLNAMANGAYYSAMVSLGDAVARDPQFLAAHSRRAEAALRLQFLDDAQTEINEAVPPFPSWWRMKRSELTRIRAIRAAIYRQWPAAIAAYASLVRSASDNEAPEALSDLAEAYAASGNAAEAREYYERALQRNPAYARALVQIGILDGREGKMDDAVKAFQRAEALYRAPSDAEGRTEALIQEGRAMASSSDPAYHVRAREILGAALTVAEAPFTENPFQKVTILLQLSLLSYRDGDTGTGSKLAQQAMDTARARNIEVLATSALVDLGNALFMQEDTARAAQYYREALSAAASHSVPAVQARAAVQLSQILLRQGHANEALAYAKQAGEFYTRSGRKVGRVVATIFMARAQRDLGLSDAALASFQTALQEATAIHNHEYSGAAQEGIASLLRAGERFPEALERYEAANSEFDPTEASDIANNELNRAELQAELGNEKAASALLDALRQLPLHEHHADLAARTAARAAAIALIELHRADADRLAAQGLALNDGEDKRNEIELNLFRCLASSVRYCETARAAAATADENSRILVSLGTARAHLTAGENEAARQVSSALLARKAAESLPETRFMAACVAEQASGRLKDELQRARYLAVAGAALKRLQETWGARAVEQFMTRPDMQALCGDVPRNDYSAVAK